MNAYNKNNGPIVLVVDAPKDLKSYRILSGNPISSIESYWILWDPIG
jgi:hypothetical protein